MRSIFSVFVITSLILFTACKTKEEAAEEEKNAQLAAKQEAALNDKRTALRTALCNKFLDNPAKASSKVCTHFKDSFQIGSVDTTLLPEASGIQSSRIYPGVFYHHNDSGNTPSFVITDNKGSILKKVAILGWTATDIEDISTGPCKVAGQPSSCIFLADTGDNLRERTELSIAVIPEYDTFSDNVAPMQILKVNLGTTKRDIEAFAVHPVSGDMFFVSKAFNNKQKNYQTPALMTIKRAGWEGRPNASLYLVGNIKLPEMYVATLCQDPNFDPLKYDKIDLNSFSPTNNTASNPVGKAMVTGMDIAPDGKTFAVITYSRIVLFGFDLSKDAFDGAPEKLRFGEDYFPIDTPKMKELHQAESITFTADGKSLVYGSEADPNNSSPLYQLDCE